MITEISTKAFTETELSQLERKGLARGAWAEGRVDDALLILDTVLAEEMTPRVAAECLVTLASFKAERGDWPGSSEALLRAAPFLDSASLSVRGSFYHQRARLHGLQGNIDAAITDYTGATVCWEPTGDRNYGAALLNLAGLYLERGDLVAARANIERALVVFEQQSSLYLCQAFDTLAKIELADGHAQLAFEAINKALGLVGENEKWRQDFLKTKEQIEVKLLDLLNVKTVDDLDRVRTGMIRRALIETGGNLTRTGNIVGLAHKSVAWIVDHNDELKPLRRKPYTRTHLKSIIKTKSE